MKRTIFISAILLLPVLTYAQKSTPDSLKQVLKTVKTDSARYAVIEQITEYYTENNFEEAVRCTDQCLVIAKRNDKLADVANDLDGKGYLLMHLGKFPESLQCLDEAKQLAEDPANKNKFWQQASQPSLNRHFCLSTLASIHHDLGHLMGKTNNIDQQIAEYRETIKLAESSGARELISLANMNLGSVYFKLNRLDSAFLFEKNAERAAIQSKFRKYLGFVYLTIAEIYLKKGNNALFLQYDHLSLNIDIEQNNIAGLGNSYHDLTKYYLTLKQPDSSLFFAKKEVIAENSLGIKNFADGYEDLYKSYRLNNETDSAYKYQGLALVARDSSFVNTVKSLNDFQKVSFKDQLRLQELEKEKEDAQSRIRTYALLAIILIVLIIAFFIYRNSRQRKKANYLLSEQKEEIAAQRDNLGRALEELKTTQTQLVQREKMASLGELTAGIAHEIQNPLNFVNNFSEVNAEMIDELKEELKNGNIAEAITIADDIGDNEKKIRHHGKRADSIVKGMLEHSRVGSGEKQLIDINALADEFLKLSYHGLRAKDKFFNAELITHFDKQLPKVNIAQQDIGRVLLNLFNNAFYAVNQKQKTAGADYKPEVTVSTSTEKNNLVIKVKDNGNGIPDAIRDKIMQPFFTTKPTGEGTGLGLSLSYDIVVKGHGGTIIIDTKEGKFTEFTITLPYHS